MFRFIVLLSVFVATYAKPGILGSSVSIAAAPAIVSVPSLNIVRTAPIVLGSTIGAPLILNNGLISNGLVSKGLIANGLVSGELISGRLVSGGLVSGGLINDGLVNGGLINGGLVSSGKLLAKGLI